jgi:AcrR family transcriptional regulator
MLKSKRDHRSARTRARLEEALMALIATKRYEDIKVGDICRKAGVGRSTFYAHYNGKDDTKRCGVDRLRASLPVRDSASVSSMNFAFSLPMLEHARLHLPTYRALARSHGGTVALEKIRGIVADLVRAEIRGRVRKRGDEQLDFEVAFLVGGYMAMLIQWLDRGARVPTEQLDDTFRRFAAAGLSGDQPIA